MGLNLVDSPRPKLRENVRNKSVQALIGMLFIFPGRQSGLMHGLGSFAEGGNLNPMGLPLSKRIFTGAGRLPHTLGLEAGICQRDGRQAARRVDHE